MNTHQLVLERRYIVRALTATAMTIVLLHGLSWLLFQAGVEQVRVVRMLFDLRTEGNIPQFFSATLFLLGSALFGMQLTLNEPDRERRRFWSVLALVFLLLACDEAGQVHEKLIQPVRRWLGDGDLGLFNYAWVLPYAALTALLAAWCWRPFLKLEPPVRDQLFIAAGLFLSGALGMELLEGAMAAKGGHGGTVDTLLYTVEEALEMGGLIILVNALLGRLASRGRRLELELR